MDFVELEPTGRNVEENVNATEENVIYSREENVVVTTVSGEASLGDKRYLIKLTLFTILGGFLFGYDTGVISSALLLIEEDYHFTTVEKELIVTITLACAGVFALLAGPINKIFGRRKAIIGSAILFGLGSLILLAAKGFNELLIGRAVVGVGLGISSMSVPVYLSECAPPSVRGKLNTANQISITFGEWIAALLGGIVSKFPFGWRILLGAAVLPAGIQLFGFLCALPESPRYLLEQGRKDEAARVLKMIRQSDCTDELNEMTAAIDAERREKSQSVFVGIGRKALIIACGLQLVAQLSGVNTIMYYAGSIVFSSGIVQEKSSAIWIVLGIISVHFATSFIGFVTIDRYGRRPLILISLAFTILALWILSLGTHLNYRFEAPVDFKRSSCQNMTNAETFLEPMVCSDCSKLYGSTCGFCEDGATGYCTTNCSSGELWIDYCPANKASIMPVIGMLLYLISFSPGLGPVPWAVGSEIFPQSIRDTGMGLAVFAHWAGNTLISVSFLSLVEAIGQASCFFIYSVIALISFILLYFFLPETKGLPLEQVPKLLSGPWRRHNSDKYTRFE